ncbi:MAG TPA: hypothetical protein PLV09_05370 [Candidatus Omnitrophota bacterium]|nr:hypothetical protein [Candidatus Omnitrophota bacterium]HPN66831.1 hypothetical protein [Candidatus Omnitrophota bacterium]HRZ66652.1 hypothetical protein [Candidatus Omnitrophota bacterium]
MSIIMEALKKASDRPATEAGRSAAVAASAEMRVVASPEPHELRFSKSFLMMFSTIMVIAAVAYFTGMPNHGPATSIDTAPKAEGYSAASAPSAPAKQEPEPTPVSNLLTKLSNPRLTLNGIVYGIGKPAAIIENKIVEEGGSIRGMRVVKIHADKVDMVDQATGQPFELKVD